MNHDGEKSNKQRAEIKENLEKRNASLPSPKEMIITGWNYYRKNALSFLGIQFILFLPVLLLNLALVYNSISILYNSSDSFLGMLGALLQTDYYYAHHLEDRIDANGMQWLEHIPENGNYILNHFSLVFNSTNMLYRVYKVSV